MALARTLLRQPRLCFHSNPLKKIYKNSNGGCTFIVSGHLDPELRPHLDKSSIEQAFLSIKVCGGKEDADR